ncbi:MAG: hypothetical protein WCT52_00845 [Candidatus Micrarchaeia archaeon]
MKASDWLREKYVYIVVLSLLILLIWTMHVFQQGGMDVESAKVYLQALTVVATLALLYYAYFNVASKREEDTARLELAVRPILIWELEGEGGKVKLAYKTIKHPIYDFHATLRLGKKTLELAERHLDVFEAHPEHAYTRNLSDFVVEGMDDAKLKEMHLNFSYHSEVGGKYEFYFTKEVLREKKGFVFQHRNFVSAKYPWRSAKIVFDDE